MKNNRILLVYHTNFLKKDAGNNAYTYAIVEALKSQGYSIDFLAISYCDDFSKVEELNLKNNKLIDNIYLYDGKIERFNHDYAPFSWVNDGLLEFFNKIINKNDYDFIYVHYVNLLELIKFSKIDSKTKVVLSMHDFESLLQFYRNKSLDAFGIDIVEEIKLLDYADEILCISCDELSFFSRFYPNKKFRLLQHFVKKQQLLSKNKDIDCLFIGHCNQYNLNAVKWFIDDVYSYLNPDMKITICGRVCEMIKNNEPEYYKKMLDYKFNIIDFAPDLDELYSRTKIAIVPMLAGTGLKIKTITAMSYGIPVVATSLGVDGFVDKSQNGCLVSDSGQEFAQYVNKLLIDKEFYNETSNNIKKYFDEHFSCEIGEKVLSEAFIKNDNFVSERPLFCVMPENVNMDSIKNNKYKNFYEKIFSVKNEYHNDKKYKVITLLGLRIKIRVKNNRKKPKVTIITVTYNLINAGREEVFEKCVESVHNQTYEDVEHIIIDGASDDGTLELIEKYAKKGWLTYYSEPDKGIYYAMNKGIEKANGKYINFLNSDDSFKVNTAIEKSVALLEKTKADFSYASSDVLDCDGNFAWVYLPQFEKAYALMPFNHQTMFVKTDILKKEGCFDTKFSSAADYDLVLRLILKKYKGIELNKIIVNYSSGGESSVNVRKSVEEQLKLYKKNYSEHVNLTDREYERMLIERFVPFKLLFKMRVSNINSYLHTLKCYFHNKNFKKWLFLFRISFKRGKSCIRLFGNYIIKPEKIDEDFITMEEYYKINNIIK